MNPDCASLRVLKVIFLIYHLAVQRAVPKLAFCGNFQVLIKLSSDNLSSLGPGRDLVSGAGAGVTLPGPRAAVSLLDGALAWLGPAPASWPPRWSSQPKVADCQFIGADAAL